MIKHIRTRPYLTIVSIILARRIGVLGYMYINDTTSDTAIIQSSYNTLLSPHTGSMMTYTLPNGLILFNTTNSTIGPVAYDYETDDSLTRYVGRNNPLIDLHYEPADLVTINNTRMIPKPYGIKIRAAADAQLNELAKEFYQIFGDKLVIVSAYRSYDHQKKITNSGCSPTLCAKPGHSEHQLGLAIDIFAATTAGEFLSRAEFKAYVERLLQNAHRYGWINTYQKGPTIDGYQPEPRHRRYVGRGLATELFEQQKTFAEWYVEKKVM